MYTILPKGRFFFFFLRNFTSQFYFTLKVFAKNALRGSRRRYIFFLNFRFDVWPGVWLKTSCLIQPTHYLLDCGVFHLYEGCLLYFGIREQKQILIIALLFFKIFSIKINTHLLAFEPIVEALLPLRLKYAQNMHYEHINCFFKYRKTLTSHFFMFGKVRAIRRMTHHIVSKM